MHSLITIISTLVVIIVIALVVVAIGFGMIMGLEFLGIINR